MFGGSLGLLDDRVGRKVPAALKRLLGKATLDDSNDDITLLVSSQYAGKVLSKTPGDKAGRRNYPCSFRSPFHTVCAPLHSTFSHTLYTAGSRSKFQLGNRSGGRAGRNRGRAGRRGDQPCCDMSLDGFGQ
jgi:hypothetical protein